MTNKITICLSLMLCFGVCGCAGTQINKETDIQNTQTTLETYNKAMFEVNRTLDTYIVRPTAKGYRKITNKTVRKGISNFFNNITEPVSALNHGLQGDLLSSGVNLGRFVINTTFGMVGLFDIAKSVGLEMDKTGFDETLAGWCVPDGPFIVLPIIGPSTPRAFAGFAVDGYTSPLYIGSVGSSDSDADLVYYGASSLKYLNVMAENINLLESLESGSIDYYETIKSTYLQNRKKIKGCHNSTSNAEYDFDMDMDEDE